MNRIPVLRLILSAPAPSVHAPLPDDDGGGALRIGKAPAPAAGARIETAGHRRRRAAGPRVGRIRNW